MLWRRVRIAFKRLMERSPLGWKPTFVPVCEHWLTRRADLERYSAASTLIPHDAPNTDGETHNRRDKCRTLQVVGVSHLPVFARSLPSSLLVPGFVPTKHSLFVWVFVGEAKLHQERSTVPGRRRFTRSKLIHNRLIESHFAPNYY